MCCGLCPASLQHSAKAQGTVTILTSNGCSGKMIGHRAAAAQEQQSKKQGKSLALTSMLAHCPQGGQRSSSTSHTLPDAHFSPSMPLEPKQIGTASYSRAPTTHNGSAQSPSQAPSPGALLPTPSDSHPRAEPPSPFVLLHGSEAILRKGACNILGAGSNSLRKFCTACSSSGTV